MNNCRTAASICLIVTTLMHTNAFAQLASEQRSADELLQKALLKVSELYDDHCAKFTGEISTIYRKDGNVLLSEIKGYSVISARPVERYHSFLKIQIQPPSRQSDAMCHESLRFADPTKTILISGKNLPLSRKDQSARNIKSWTLLTSSPEKAPEKWNWPELDPLGLIFTTGNAWTYGDFGSFPTQLGLLQSMRLRESKQLKNGDVEGKWHSGNGKALVEVIFAKEMDFMPVRVRTKPADDSTPGVFETKTVWKKSNELFLPVTQQLTYVEKGTFGERESQLDIKWIWLPPKVWEDNRLSFDQLTKENPENELIPHVEGLFLNHAKELVFLK